MTWSKTGTLIDQANSACCVLRRGFVKSLSVRQCMHRHLDIDRLDTQALHAVQAV